MASRTTAAPNFPNLTIRSPLLNAEFFITADAVWPSIPFHTDAVLEPGEQLDWDWSMQWRHFSVKGSVSTETAFWDAQGAITNFGGALTVVARRGTVKTAATSVRVLGTQPEASEVLSFLNSRPESQGFDKIVTHESRMKHFDATANPVTSFDNGYGMAQLTEPEPTYDQVWNWKLNLTVGLGLFAQKRTEAAAYLSRHGGYTDHQLLRETVSRWNGGSYHIWDPPIGWVRKPSILCDSKTGNIGWEMSHAANKGRTEAELHARDAAHYGHAPRLNDGWGYFGVCYADAVLGI